MVWYHLNLGISIAAWGLPAHVALGGSGRMDGAGDGRDGGRSEEAEAERAAGQHQGA